MKKIVVLALSFLAIVACKKEETFLRDGYSEPLPLLVVNEGAYAENVGQGSISRYTPTSDRYQKNVYGGVDYKGFGGTTCYATKWQNKLYVVSKDNNKGSILSEYNDLTGDYIRSIDKIDGIQGSAFVMINNKLGVLTTDKGGVITIDMVDFKVKGKLKGVEDATRSGNMIIKNNSLYLINSAKGLLCYPLSDLENADPTILTDKVSEGFVESKDGFLWAYYNESYTNASFEVNEVTTSTLIKIDPKSNQMERISVDCPMLPNLFSYRPHFLTASTVENCLFFVKSSEMPNTTIFRYDIDKRKVESFYQLEQDLYFTGSPLVFNPSNNSLSMLYTNKDYSKIGIQTIDASTAKFRGKLDFSGLTDAEKYPSMLLLDTK